MNDISNALLSIDLSDGTKFRFENHDEIVAWLDKEQSAFEWLVEGGAQAGAGVTNLRQSFINSLRNVRDTLNRWRASPADNELKEQFANSLRNVYSSETTVRSDHEFARIASDIAAKDGAIAGAAAFGLLLGVDSQVTFPSLKGIIQAMLKRSGIDPRSSDIVSKAIADLNSSASTDRARSIAEWSGITEQARALLDTTDKSFKT